MTKVHTTRAPRRSIVSHTLLELVLGFALAIAGSLGGWVGGKITDQDASDTRAPSIVIVQYGGDMRIEAPSVHGRPR